MSTRTDQWRDIAMQALEQYEAAHSTGVQRPMALAYIAQTYAWLSPAGWDDPKAVSYLGKLFAQRNPDGGWGLGYAYDAFQNGNTNPATTTYTVTLADHVGRPLLDAYKAGRVAPTVIQEIINLITSTPRIDTAQGRGLAYSRHANDAKPGFLVHNVSAGAAAFLLECGDAGFPVMWWLVQGITQREVSAYNASTRFWSYSDASAPGPQDADHNSYSAESMALLAPAIGYTSVFKHMTTEFADTEAAPLAHMRLTAVPDMPGHPRGEFLVRGDQWIPEAQAFALAMAGNGPRLAQIAYCAAKATVRSAAHDAV